MTRVRIDLNISLVGYASTTDQSPENPMGEDWERHGARHLQAIAPKPEQ